MIRLLSYAHRRVECRTRRPVNHGRCRSLETIHAGFERTHRYFRFFLLFVVCFVPARTWVAPIFWDLKIGISEPILVRICKRACCPHAFCQVLVKGNMGLKCVVGTWSRNSLLLDKKVSAFGRRSKATERHMPRVSLCSQKHVRFVVVVLARGRGSGGSPAAMSESVDF